MHDGEMHIMLGGGGGGLKERDHWKDLEERIIKWIVKIKVWMV
jgi:hypothetical protein